MCVETRQEHGRRELGAYLEAGVVDAANEEIKEVRWKEGRHRA